MCTMPSHGFFILSDYKLSMAVVHRFELTAEVKYPVAFLLSLILKVP